MSDSNEDSKTNELKDPKRRQLLGMATAGGVVIGADGPDRGAAIGCVAGRH